jgi:tetratricopeptide (TPR) repeat protein
MLASQIALGGGDLVTAIKTAELGVLSDSSDFGALFQLGYLRYQNKDYALAAEALGKALTLNSNYANARYFLGLSEAKLGKWDEALSDLLAVQQGDPDNASLKRAIKLVKAKNNNFD